MRQQHLVANDLDHEFTQASQNLNSRVSESTDSWGQLQTELTGALAHQEFRVYYQPIVYLETDQIAGFEALVRWQHPTRGLLCPVDFLQAAEETGLIVPIGLWVLREASTQVQRWHRRFPDNPNLHVSVNISCKQFQQPDLVEQINVILHETGLTPASLQLELTETLVMQNSESARDILLQLRALNVKLAIDDFGAGYSSLSYLQKFPVHTLKIDRSFISRLQDAKENLEIVRAVVTLAHNLGLDVVAEGMETAHHTALLKILKCEFGQGYCYSKPVDAECAEALIVAASQSVFAMSTATDEKARGIVVEDGCKGQHPPQALLSAMANSGEIVKSVKVHFDNRDGQALKKMMTLALDVAPGTNSGETQGSQEQKLREEFEIHIEDVKREAIKQFDEELYSVCVGTFRFLCELEPENRTLRDYLDLTQRLVGELAKETCDSTPSSNPSSLTSATKDILEESEERNGEALAITFGNKSEPGDGQESRHSNRSIDQGDNQVSRATEGPSGLPISAKNARRFTLIAAAAFIVFGVTLEPWRLRQRQSAAAPTSVQIDRPAIGGLKLSDLKASAKSLGEPRNLRAPKRSMQSKLAKRPAFPGNTKETIRSHDLQVPRSNNPTENKHQGSLEHRTTAGVSGSQPKPLLGVARGTLAASKNPIRELPPEILTYAVIHDHLIGSCRGNLKIGGESITFEPREGTRHSFIFKLTDIIGTERGDSLKIKFKHDTYRFKTSAKDKSDNRSKLAEMDRRLTRSRAEVALAKY